MDPFHAKRKRDAVIRRKLLFALAICRTSPTGGISGRELMNQVAGLLPPRQGFESDDHALLLMRDLVAAKLAEERKLGERRRGQSFGIDWIELAITERGLALYEQKIPANDLVDDDRQLDE